MSNIFSQDPLILDTVWGPGQSPVVAVPTALTNGTVYNQTFRRIVWVDPTSAGDQCEITDQNGNIILNTYASVAHADVVLWDAGDTRRSLVLKQGLWNLNILGSGKLYLYR